MRQRLFALSLTLLLAACSEPSRPAPRPKPVPQANLTEPEHYCAECHPRHVEEWRTSSHAYALHDPVFAAMLRYGQQETRGVLGDFCVRCHTPIGTRAGETLVRADGQGDAATFVQPITGLSQSAMDGVSCFVCHSITKVNTDANADFEMASDGVRRGPIADPETSPVHSSVGTSMFEETHICGTCHVVVNPNRVALERTHIEWEQSIFAGMKSCQDCHMPSYKGQAAVGHRQRTVHEHGFVGVDVSLLPPEDFPGYEAGRTAAEELLQQSATLAVTADPGAMRLRLEIHNLAGHALPSGAVADRQMWVELVVTDDAGNVVLESGTLDDNGDLRVDDPLRTTRPSSDPQLLLYGQVMLFTPHITGLDAGTQAIPVDFLWEPTSEKSHLIPPSVTDRPSYDLSALPHGAYSAKVRLLFRTFPPHVLRRLEAVAALDPAVKTRVPTVEMAVATTSFSL